MAAIRMLRSCFAMIFFLVASAGVSLAQPQLLEEVDGWEIFSFGKTKFAKRKPAWGRKDHYFEIMCVPGPHPDTDIPDTIWYAAIEGALDGDIGRLIRRSYFHGNAISIWINDHNRTTFYVFTEGTEESGIAILFLSGSEPNSDEAAFQAGKDSVTLFIKSQSITFKDGRNDILAYDLRGIEAAYRSLIAQGCQTIK